MSNDSEDTIIFGSESADRSVEAFVDQDDRVAHFFLSSKVIPEFGMKSCWVRNLVAAPETLDASGMRDGRAPLQPRRECRHPAGAPPLDPQRLSIVWLEEGTGAALLEDDEVIALIPAWGGYKGFRGYARDAIGTGALAWELQSDNRQLLRVAEARECWREWEVDSLWERVQSLWHSHYVGVLGQEKKYYATDGGNWPPSALMRFDQPEGEILITLGARLRPQPNVPDEGKFRRIELAMFVESGCSEDALLKVASYISGQSKYPWLQNTWLGDGHTLPCDSIPGFDAVLLTDVPPVQVGTLMADYRNDTVSLLWMIPITQSQRELAIANGSKALLAQLQREGVRGLGQRKRVGILGRLFGRTV
jgi:hypothetical protein